jgi:hypothetical protein
MGLTALIPRRESLHQKSQLVAKLAFFIPQRIEMYFVVVRDYFSNDPRRGTRNKENQTCLQQVYFFYE